MPNALIIRSPHIEKILSGQKIWEIRGSRTKVRGKIGLIRAGSGTIVGVCDLVDVVGPLTLAELRRNAAKAGLRAAELEKLRYETTYGWVLDNIRELKPPRSYRHPPGAMIWVKVDRL